MSKQKETVGSISWGPARAIREDEFSYLEGRLLTLIETLGLPTNQEQAFKSLVKQEIWRSHSDTVFLSAELHTQAHKEHENVFASEE